MRTTSRSPQFTLIAALVTLPSLALAQDAEATAAQRPTGGDAPAGMVHFAANPEQPMGMDEAAVKAFLTKDLGRDLAKWEKFDFVWKNGFLFFTPRHTQPLADVFLAQHEVTNAQWRVFLQAPINQDTGETSAGMTLISLVRYLYGIKEEMGPNVQRAWLYLYELNRDVLEPVLNPEGKVDFDPLMTQAGDASLPSGLELRYSILQPPHYWTGGTPPDDEMDRPVRFISWADARAFCRWAGLHLPLEVEWERGARGAAGDRRFAWGDTWNAENIVWKRWKIPSPGRPETVESHPQGATPEGLHHMAGNVSEYVFDLARPYPGTKAKFIYTGAGVLARGGNYEDDDYVFLAADRIWDVGASQIGPLTRTDGFGFRFAAYPDAARELCLDLATYAEETTRRVAPYVWFPHPPGLSKRDLEKTDKRRVLQGFAIERAAGWIERSFDAAAENHAFVTGPAKGIALLPIKGLASTELKSAGDLEKLAADPELTLLVGALVSTDTCHIDLLDETGVNKKRVHLGGADEFHVGHDLGFRYQSGAWLVLRGNRIAVYPGNGGNFGGNGAHLREAPLGYLPGTWIETAKWVDTADARAAAKIGGGVATLTVAIPQVEVKTGEVKRSGRAAVITVNVPLEFADR